MANKYILAIDQGTTGTTALLVNKKGHIKCKANKEFRQIFPQPSWVEHNPEDIWKTVLWSISEVIKKANIKKTDIIAIGITNQRETVLAWDKKTGKILHRAIVWQCRRTAAFCQKLKDRGLERKIFNKTGLVVDPYFSSSKMRWILQNKPEIKKNKNAVFGTIDSYLIYKLSGKKHHITDVSNASRTQLMSLSSLSWDPELLHIFKVPERMLPQIVSSNPKNIVTKNMTILPDNIPISGVAGDQQAALFGQQCFSKGDAKCTFGTGSFILMNTGTKRVHSKHRLLSTVAWKLHNQKPVYALEGGAFICGASVQWLRDGLQFFKKSLETQGLAEQSAKGNAMVEFVPCLSGLSVPYWKPFAKGAIFGLTRATTRADIVRATLEGMALQNVDVLKAMSEDLGYKMKTIRVDGGASQNNFLMQVQSDYLGMILIRSKYLETTGLGVALLAGLGVGFWSSLKDLENGCFSGSNFKPKMVSKFRKKRLHRWHQAVQAILHYHQSLD